MKVTKLAAVCLSALILSGTLPSAVVNGGYAALSTVKTYTDVYAEDSSENDPNEVLCNEFKRDKNYIVLEDEIVISNGKDLKGNITIRCKDGCSLPIIINVKAFAESAIESITLPENVVKIGEKAFTKCTKLKEIRIENPNCQIYDDGNTICVAQSSGDGGPTFGNGVIIGYAGSTAQAYAEKYGYNFRAIEGAPAATTTTETTTTTTETTTETTTTTTTETTTTTTETTTTTTTETTTETTTTEPETTTETTTVTTTLPEITSTETLTTVSSTETIPVAETTTVQPSQEASNVSTTTTTIAKRMNTYLLDVMTTTSSSSTYPPAVQGKPVFHLSHTEVCLDDARTKTQTAEIYVDGANQLYCNSLIYLYFDDRMKVGEAVGESAISKLTSSHSAGDTGDFIVLVTAGRTNSGKDGLMRTVDFTLPSDCKVGDIYTFEIGPTKYGEKPLFTNIENNDAGKAMTEYIFTKGVSIGSIRVVENPPYALGDVNNDKFIDSVDASMVLAEYAKRSTGMSDDNEDESTMTEPFKPEQEIAGDVNCDGIIDAVDASLILAYYAYVSGTKEPMTLTQFIKSKG